MADKLLKPIDGNTCADQVFPPSVVARIVTSVPLEAVAEARLESSGRCIPAIPPVARRAVRLLWAPSPYDEALLSRESCEVVDAAEPSTAQQAELDTQVTPASGPVPLGRL